MRNDKRELLKQLDKGRYEETEEGILLPEAGVMAGGEYFVDSPGYEPEWSKNSLTDEGLNYLLECGLNGATQLPNFYIALFANDYTPTRTLTAAQFPATAGEITSATEGYSESERQIWTPNDAAAGVMDNVGVLSSFTIATASSITIRGAALSSSNLKGSTTGKLISATKLQQARTQYSGDVFTTGYRVTLNPV